MLHTPRIPKESAAMRWRRRESKVGAVRSQESAGARRRVVSCEESGGCGAEGGEATVQGDGRESRRCSNVASGTMLADVLEAVEGALRALDAGEIDTATGRLRALAAAVRITCHVPDEHGV